MAAAAGIGCHGRRARQTNNLSAVRMAAGPAVMYLTNTIFGGVFAIAQSTRERKQTS